MKPFYCLSDFPERRRAGKNYIAECPKCGKKHLAISRDTGLYCCFYAGCDFHGKLKDFWTERRSTGWQDAGNPAGSFADGKEKCRERRAGRYGIGRRRERRI